MEQCDQNRNLPIVLREYKKDKLVFNLYDIEFIQKIDRNVFVFVNNNRNHNLFCRHISSTRDLIEKQNLQNHFYMNTQIIVSYHFFKRVIDITLPDRLGINVLRSYDLQIGMNEYRSLKEKFKYNSY